MQSFTDTSKNNSESEDSNVIFVSAAPAKASLNLFEVSEPRELEQIFEEDW